MEAQPADKGKTTPSSNFDHSASVSAGKPLVPNDANLTKRWDPQIDLNGCELTPGQKEAV